MVHWGKKRCGRREVLSIRDGQETSKHRPLEFGSFESMTFQREFIASLIISIIATERHLLKRMGFAFTGADLRIELQPFRLMLLVFYLGGQYLRLIGPK